MAVVENGKMVRLDNEWSRTALAAELIAMRDRTDRLIVGLDFAFSFPASYISQQGWNSVTDVWRAARDHGEEWLQGGIEHPAFWGRVRKSAIEGHQEYRRTELTLQGRKIRPKSIFQTGGAGAVGTAAIRGMSFLLELSNAGFAIWPFDDPAGEARHRRDLPQTADGSSHQDVRKSLSRPP